MHAIPLYELYAPGDIHAKLVMDPTTINGSQLSIHISIGYRVQHGPAS